MGKAFHRKQIPINRSRTRGIGFKYVDVVQPVVRELTAEQVSAREVEAQQQATLVEQHRAHQRCANAVIELATKILHEWKEASDYNDQLLVEFPGWATVDYCPLPVEEDLASFYTELIQSYQNQADYPLTLAELDEIVEVCRRRRVSTSQVVEEATKAVRYTAQACTTFEGVDITHFAQMLSKRAARAKGKNNDLDSALAFVCKQMALMFQKEPSVAA